MRQGIVIVALLVSLVAGASAQPGVVSTSKPYAFDASTDSVFHSILSVIKLRRLDALPMGERVAAIAKLMMEKPYIDKSLEVGTDRFAVCTFEGFDCVTLFETAWALARFVARSSDSSFGGFLHELQRTRYLHGIPVGYQSRLHYTSDYFYENTKNGLLKEMTGKVGDNYAELETKTINFMSTHTGSYPQLRDNPAMLDSIKGMENRINTRGGYYYIKKRNVATVESKIETGDLIGITTSIGGIDCSHTGIAIRLSDGRIHLLHASLTELKVVITEKPFADYLASNNRQTGIMIYRPLEVTPQ